MYSPQKTSRLHTLPGPRPHVADFIQEVLSITLIKHDRDWDEQVITSLLPMYLHGVERANERGRLIDLYDHLSSLMKGFGGQQDYDVLEELVREIRTKYEKAYCYWYYHQHEKELHSQVGACANSNQ